MTDLDLDAIRERAEAATGTAWHWAGNTDTGEPYLATWIPGAGRCQVLSIGSRERTAHDPGADSVREYAHDIDADAEEMVREWMTDQYGEPVRDPQLWFYTDLMADPAVDHVVYEVAPKATTRQDPKVYRADITGIRHPDAEFIAHARTDVPALLAEVERLRARLDAVEALLADGPDTWEGYDTRDIGHAFLADSVTDFTADLRAALETDTTTKENR